MKAVLLDLGGVLLDLHPNRSFRHWAEKGGTSVEALVERWHLDDTFEAYEMGLVDFDALVASLEDMFGVTMSREDWLIGWNNLLGEPRQRVAERCHALAETMPLYLFSNTNPEHEAVWRQSCEHALAPFETLYVSSRIGRRKPSVEAFRWVVADMGFAAGDVVFFDDNADNIQGAQTAGLHTVHVTDAAVAERHLDELLKRKKG